MSKLTIGLGTLANDGTGDSLRVAGGKINDNFSEIYTAFGDGSSLSTLPTDLSDLTDSTNLLFDGAYSSLSGAPTIPADVSDLTDTTNLLFDGAYSSLSGSPSLATVATSGLYSDLSGTPTIPADVSDLTDNTNLLFDGAYSSLSGAPSIPADVSDLTDNTNLLFDGAYSSLSGAPSIPADTGDLTNNAGFVANADATLTLAVSTSAPGTPVSGMFAVADGNTTGWDPKGTNLGVAYPVFYDGSSWTALF